MTPWKQFKQDFKGKKVLIMGLGLQGRGAGDAAVFSEAGARVTVTDLKEKDQLQSSIDKLKAYDITYVLGEHREKDFENTDIVIRNPDVTSSPYLDIARKAGAAIKMDSSLFAKYCDSPIIGITGTRGKTTTTMMIYEIFKENLKKQVLLGGNVPGKATLELLREIAPSQSIVILELSSWELKGWHDEKISPQISVLTNLYEDHLNRYSSMKEYFKDKTAIFKYQKKEDWLILNRKFKGNQGFREYKGRTVYFSTEDLSKDFRLKIPGEHNRENAAAALAVGKILGISEMKILKSLKKFGGVAYRLQKIATINGVDFINDTTSTTPIAGKMALKAMIRPIILIAGGASKKLNPKPFAEEIEKGLKEKRIKGVILLKGEGTDEILSDIASPARNRQAIALAGRLDPSSQTPQAFGSEAQARRDDIRIYDNFEQAIRKAAEMAKVGDAVLLSPGCASFSMFKNEFDRGEQFNKIISKMQN